MSLITLGLVLVISGDGYTALIAFSLAGAMLAFLYFNFNPARIFMGDTGSLILGFVISVLSIRLMQLNINAPKSLLPNAPIFALGIVLLPVFDTLRVFAGRIWNGKSPFEGDRTHIHHLLTNGGFDHSFASRLICVVHGAILMEVSWFRNLRPELTLCILIVFMLFATAMIRKLGASNKLRASSHFPYRI
jgi:UDP-N-acetylmuramyl pentapeptide phosphotransferase/UDP-N-acetylglucosamine-1-phosphate transferase